MNGNLMELNQIYKQIEALLHPDYKTIATLPDDELKAFSDQREKAMLTHQELTRRFQEIKADLSVEDVIEAFEIGSSSLKTHLLALMRSKFDPRYIPAIRKSISNDEFEGIYLILPVLERHLDRHEITEVVIHALDSRYPHVRDVALGMVQALRLAEILPKVREKLHDRDEIIQMFAHKINSEIEG